MHILESYYSGEPPMHNIGTWNDHDASYTQDAWKWDSPFYEQRIKFWV